MLKVSVCQKFSNYSQQLHVGECCVSKSSACCVTIGMDCGSLFDTVVVLPLNTLGLEELEHVVMAAQIAVFRLKA